MIQVMIAEVSVMFPAATDDMVSGVVPGAAVVKV